MALHLQTTVWTANLGPYNCLLKQLSLLVAKSMLSSLDLLVIVFESLSLLTKSQKNESCGNYRNSGLIWHTRLLNMTKFPVFSPLGERTQGSLWVPVDCVWSCDCLDEPAVTPESFVEGFRPLTGSESLGREGETTDLWDWKKAQRIKMKCVQVSGSEGEQSVERRRG